jgi:spore coat polysaccharide biosynthesis predicted glycosyltransferase SpsG
VAVVAANAALAEAVVVAVNQAAVTQAKNRAAAASVAEKTLRA